MIGLAVCLFLHQGGTTDPSSYQWLCAENTSRNHWRSWSESRLWDPQAIQRNSSVIAMNRTTGQYGLRGVRVGEASHPGPPKLLLRRPGHLSTPEVGVTQVDTHADLVATVLEFDDGDTESVAGSVPDISGEEDSPVEDEVTQSPALVFGAGAAALQELDEVELEAEFITRACVMKFPLSSCEESIGPS